MRARLVAGAACVWALARMGPAPSALANLGRWRELAFVHALTWSHLAGVRCGWCVGEAARLNALRRGAPVAPTPVAEVASLDGAWDASRPFVVRGALPSEPWTYADLDNVTGAFAFQCAADIGAELAPGREFGGYGCAARLPLGDGLRRGFYVRQNNRVLREAPFLAAKAGLTDPFFARLREGAFSVRGVFLGDWDGAAGGPGRGSSLHADLSANWYAQRAGTKAWTLVDPAEAAFLLPAFDGRRGVPALFSALGFGGAGDAAAPLSAFPRLRVALGVGDLLYVPSWWWHEVENAPGLNGAVALRGPRSVARSLAPPNFATVGSLPDVLVQLGRLIATRLGRDVGSFEDAFLPADDDGGGAASCPATSSAPPP